MTTPDDKFKPQEGRLPVVPEWEEEPPRGFRCGNPALEESLFRPDSEPPDLSRFEPRPATDWLAVLGVGAAVIAFLLWAWPEYYFYGSLQGFFTTARLPAVAAFLAVSFVLLLLRRR